MSHFPALRRFSLVFFCLFTLLLATGRAGAGVPSHGRVAHGLTALVRRAAVAPSNRHAPGSGAVYRLFHFAPPRVRPHERKVRREHSARRQPQHRALAPQPRTGWVYGG